MGNQHVSCACVLVITLHHTLIMTGHLSWMKLPVHVVTPIIKYLPKFPELIYIVVRVNGCKGHLLEDIIEPLPDHKVFVLVLGVPLIWKNEFSPSKNPSYHVLK